MPHNLKILKSPLGSLLIFWAKETYSGGYKTYIMISHIIISKLLKFSPSSLFGVLSEIYLKNEFGALINPENTSFGILANFFWTVVPEWVATVRALLIGSRGPWITDFIGLAKTHSICPSPSVFAGKVKSRFRLGKIRLEKEKTKFVPFGPEDGTNRCISRGFGLRIRLKVCPKNWLAIVLNSELLKPPDTRSLSLSLLLSRTAASIAWCLVSAQHARLKLSIY